VSAEPAAAAPPVTIAGIGNWLVAADRIGPRVLETIGERYGAAVELADIGSGGLALLDVLRGQKLLIVVDACAGLARSGDVIVVEGQPAEAATRGVSAHQIGPAEALAIARHLDPPNLPQRTVMVLAETADLDDGELERVRARVVTTVDSLVRDALSPTGSSAIGRRPTCP
jgi:hydrogenase maturation protease